MKEVLALCFERRIFLHPCVVLRDPEFHFVSDRQVRKVRLVPGACSDFLRRIPWIWGQWSMQANVLKSQIGFLESLFITFSIFPLANCAIQEFLILNPLIFQNNQEETSGDEGKAGLDMIRPVNTIFCNKRNKGAYSTLLVVLISWLMQNLSGKILPPWTM